MSSFIIQEDGEVISSFDKPQVVVSLVFPESTCSQMQDLLKQQAQQAETEFNVTKTGE